jgi:ubiquinol-cytochrome c reductase cytochrome b subunit
VFYLVLLGSASGDVLSTSFGLSVNSVIWMGRIALVVLPLVTYSLTRRLCIELQRRETAVVAHMPRAGTPSAH